MTKRIFMLFILFNCCFVFGWEPEVCNGTWMSGSYYNIMVKEPPSSVDYKNFKKNNYGKLDINFDSDGIGSYGVVGLQGFRIKCVEQITDEEVTLHITHNGSDIGKVYITICDEDLIYTDDDVYTNNDEYWYRIADKTKTIINYGKINDTRVRLRTKPNLDCDTWAFLNTGDEVTIIDKSKEKQKIGDMEDYWYQVETQQFPDGWVYGAFINIE